MKILNITFKFDSASDYFFKNLVIDFAPKSIHFIQGKNGVGKSTLFSILQGKTSKSNLLNATCELDGTLYNVKNGALDSEFTNHIKMVQQRFDRMIADDYTVEENLRLAMLPCYPGLSLLPNDIKLQEIITLVGIDMHKKARFLSGGQRQILAILMALQKETKILLLDEPTAALDEKNARMVMQFLHTLRNELDLTIIIICHDKSLVMEYAEKVYFMMHEDSQGHRMLSQVQTES